MALPAELSDVLAGPMQGITRIVVRHERRSAFRLLSLIELVFWIAFMALFLFCLLIVFVFSAVLDGDGDLGADGDGFHLPWKVRFFRYWHELLVVCQDETGAVTAQHSVLPRDDAEGHALLVAVLNAADRAGLVVVETYGGDVSETFEVYYGGQPLLAHPDLRSMDEATATLTGEGYDLEWGDGEIRLVRTEPAASKLGAGFRLAFCVLGVPFLFWQRSHWGALSTALADLRGVPPRSHVVTVYANRRLTTHNERAGEVSDSHTVDARDLLAITYAPSLGYDKDVTRHPARVRLLERDQTWSLIRGEPRVCRALRDLLLILAVEQWEGIPSTSTRPTRCPYCGTLFVFGAQQTCPSCGASPGALG